MALFKVLRFIIVPDQYLVLHDDDYSLTLLGPLVIAFILLPSRSDRCGTNRGHSVHRRKLNSCRGQALHGR